MPNAIEQIYDQLTQVFGGTDSNQFFCMQMPGTSLNQQTYAYDVNGVKPALVAEAESQLVDQMFDLTQVSGSSNGQRVSNQFLQALSVLVPNFDPMMPELKNTLRQFINTPMPANTLLNGVPFTGTLQEYYFALYDQWIQKKLAWDTDQQTQKEFLASDPSTANEKFLEWYEGVAEGRLAEIDALMGQVLAVFAPSDMEAIMGALASGPSGEIDEALNIVKDIRLMSPSGGWVYPVELTPNDWFLDLTSDIDPVDLLQDPQFIAAGITARREALMASISQVQALLNTVPTPAAMQAAVQAMSSAQSSYTTAQNNLLNTYADNTATAVEMYLAAETGGAGQGSDEEALSDLNSKAAAVSKAKGQQPPAQGATKKGGAPISAADVQKLVAGQKSLIAAQSSLLTSSQALADAGLNLAAAQSQSFANLPVVLARLQSQLADLTTQQQQLSQSIGAFTNALPSSPPPTVLSPSDSALLQPILDAAVAAANAANATAAQVATAVSNKVGSSKTLGSISTIATNASTVKASASDVAVAVRAAATALQASDISADIGTAADAIATDGEKAAASPNATAQSVATAVDNAISADSTHATALAPLQHAADAAAAVTATPDDVVTAVTAAINSLSLAPSATKSATSQRFMEMQLSFTASDMDNSSSTNTSFSQTSWGVDLFFGSASGSSSNSSSVTTQNSLDKNTAIQIGLKAAKVDITREWFDPGLFKLTKDMSRISQNIVSAGTLPTKPATGGGTTIDWSSPSITHMNEAILPSFPVAFVVAKDITIKFQASSSSLAAVHSVIDSKSAAGGGFLCFSVSSSSASHSDSQSLSTRTEGTVITITMPGPQILGWFVELTPVDSSKQLTDSTQPTPDINIMKFVNMLQAFAPLKAVSGPAK